MLLYVDIDKTKFTQCDVALKCGGKMWYVPVYDSISCQLIVFRSTVDL